MEPNIQYILDSIRTELNPYAGDEFRESTRADITNDLDDLLRDLKHQNRLANGYVFLVTGEPLRADIPIHVELNISAEGPNGMTVLFNLLVQITHNGAFVYALCVDNDGDVRLGVYGDGSAKSTPKQPISENPNDAWNRAMKGM